MLRWENERGSPNTYSSTPGALVVSQSPMSLGWRFLLEAQLRTEPHVIKESRQKPPVLIWNRASRLNKPQKLCIYQFCHRTQGCSAASTWTKAQNHGNALSVTNALTSTLWERLSSKDRDPRNSWVLRYFLGYSCMLTIQCRSLTFFWLATPRELLEWAISIWRAAFILSFSIYRIRTHINLGTYTASELTSTSFTMASLPQITSPPTAWASFYREAGLQDRAHNPPPPRLPKLIHQYRNLSPDTQSKVHVVAPDLPGFGFTEVPENRHTNTHSKNLTSSIEALFVDAFEPQENLNL